MKKSVIVLIFIIYIASIVFINFFGMKIMSYETNIYAERIECINSDMTLSKDGSYKYIILNYASNPTYTIQHKIYPENVTINKVEYVYDQDNNFASIDSNGNITFSNITEPTMLSVIIKTTDNTNRTAEIRIYIS